MNAQNFSDFVYLVSFAVYMFCLALPVAATFLWVLAQLVGGNFSRAVSNAARKFRGG